MTKHTFLWTSHESGPSLCGLGDVGGLEEGGLAGAVAEGEDGVDALRAEVAVKHDHAGEGGGQFDHGAYFSAMRLVIDLHKTPDDINTI